MSKTKHGKNYIRKELIYSVDGDGKKVGVHLYYSDGYVKTLLNPYGKSQKYYEELRYKKRITDDGIVKTDDRGQIMTLDTASRAYRSGYLDARKDSAKAYKAKHK